MEYIILLANIVIIVLLMRRGNSGSSYNLNSSNAGGKTTASEEVIIDTCALIDGRILELAKTGFVPGSIVVPDFVVNELQMLADGKDPLKRQRARHGLDMITELQANEEVHVSVIHDSIDNTAPVDDRLVALAGKRRAHLYTTDYNLSKVATIEGVKVLNVNELAQLLRPVILPGETVEVKLVQKGNDPGQAVGYLADGTMVVVDNAARSVGSKVSVEITRNLQTVAGKMMFGSLKRQQVAHKKPSNQKTTSSNTSNSNRTHKSA